MLIENFRDLASHSSLHGVKFLADSSKWYQRLYWIVALVVCSFIASDLIREDWLSWNSYPVEIAEDFSPKPLSSVFIPAVTICDDTLVSKDLGDGYTGDITKDSEIIHLCRVLMDGRDFCEFIRNGTFSEAPNITMSELKKKMVFNIYKTSVVPSHELTLENEIFHKYGYSTLVTPGPKGLCQTVGLLNLNQVYRNTNLAQLLVEESDSFENSKNTSVDSDSFTSLPVILTVDGEDEFSYPSIFSDLKGFKLKFAYDYKSIDNESTWERIDSECTIAVHNPWEVPSPFIHWQPCDSLLDSNILISYKIDYTYSDSDVIEAPVADRDCLYPHEKSLKYFLYYSQKNCLFECIAKKMAEECGCVTPHMPNSDEVKFCEETESKNCADELLDAQFVNQFTSDNSCDCLPLCNYIDYTIIDLEPVLTIGKQSTRNVVEFRFKDNYINPLHRYLTDTVFKFWISTMNTLDMFLGFSVLSILELIYFLIIIVMRWVDEERHDYKDRQEQRKRSTVSAASWCTVCEPMKPVSVHIGKKPTEDSVSFSSRINHINSPAYIDELAFEESHKFNDNCVNCRKLQSMGLNKQVIQMLKNVIKREIEEHWVGFQDHESLSELRQMIEEIRSDVLELKRRRDVWE